MSIDLERTPDGRRLCVSREIPAPAETVWNVLVDTRQWSEWGPSVSAVDCADRRIRRGSTGRVQVLGGPWVPFEITTCRDRRWTWAVARVPATGHRVEAPSDDRCRAVFEIPPLASGYAVVCRRALRNVDRLAATGGEGPPSA
ncbi:MAG: SRPBCC family protein [Haloarculaceae archaeon]